MSGVWFDASLLSTAAPASNRGLQVESVDGADAALYRLRLPRVYQERDHGPASTPSFHTAGLYVGLAGAANLLLDFSQHAVVSLSIVKNSDPAIRVAMLPRDTNSQGTIFGGVILSYIDMAGAIEAHRHTGMDRFVTVAMREVIFHEPRPRQLLCRDSEDRHDFDHRASAGGSRALRPARQTRAGYPG